MKWNMQKENPGCKNALKLLNEISPGALKPSQSESTAAEYLKLCNSLLLSFFHLQSSFRFVFFLNTLLPSLLNLLPKVFLMAQFHFASGNNHPDYSSYLQITQ